MLPRVKICCIQSIEEAWLAIKYGASAIGLVSEMPSGPGPIAEKLIKEIAAIIPPDVTSVLLTDFKHFVKNSSLKTNRYLDLKFSWHHTIFFAIN